MRSDSVQLDGSNLSLLDPGDSDHESVSLSESGAFLVSNSSRVSRNTPLNVLANTVSLQLGDE